MYMFQKGPCYDILNKVPRLKEKIDSMFGKIVCVENPETLDEIINNVNFPLCIAGTQNLSTKEKRKQDVIKMLTLGIEALSIFYRDEEDYTVALLMKIPDNL